MLDHVIVTVSDFTRSIAFYEQALKPLGITDLLDYKGQDGHPDLKGFGNDGRFFFWLKEGRPLLLLSPLPHTHVAAMRKQWG